MIAIFARPNHPIGYGMPQPISRSNAGGHGTAHGYVVLLVRCKSRKQAAKVAERLRDWRRPFHGIQEPDAKGWKGYTTGWLGEWYGGNFDLLGLMPGNDPEFCWESSKGLTPTPGRFISKGDSRFVGIYTADEVLNN